MVITVELLRELPRRPRPINNFYLRASLLEDGGGLSGSAVSCQKGFVVSTGGDLVAEADFNSPVLELSR